MLNKYCKHILLVLSCAGAAFFISSCHTGLKLEDLALPDQVLQDASVAFFEADRSGVINDYARVETGETTPDGFNVTEPTDADGIMKAATGDKSRLFIQLPAQEARRDHILRAIASASIREDLKKGDQWKINVLNTKAIKSEIATFGFNDVKAKEYYLTIAKRLNKKLSSNDILIVNIDDFVPSLSPDEFFEALTTPHIIALSSESIDTVKFFDDKAKGGEFLAAGLNPGHIYEMAKFRMLRSKQVTQKADQDKLALLISKVMTALEPNGNLSTLAKFFTAIDPLVDGPSPVANLESEILKSLSRLLKANYKYVTSLNLDTRTLSDIHDKVERNLYAFSEQARKTDKIFKNIEIMMRSGLGTIGERMSKGFRETRSDLDDIRNQAIPGLERSLLDSGEKNRDDITGHTNRTVENSTTRLITEGKERHNATQKALTKQISSIIDDAQERIAERARIHAEDLTHVFIEYVKNSLKRVIEENATVSDKAVRNINQVTAQLLKRAIDNLSEHTTAVGDDTVRKVENDTSRHAGELRAHGRMMSARVTDDVTKSIINRVNQVQTALAASTADTVRESENVIKQVVGQEAVEVKDLIMASLRRIINEQRAALAGLGINEHTSAVIKRTEKILADAMAQAEDEIKKKVEAEHFATREDLASQTSRNVGRSTAQITESNVAQHETTKGYITKKLGQDIRSDIEQAITRSADDVKDVLSDVVALALKRILKESKAAVLGIPENVNAHTSGTMNRVQRILADALTQAEDELKKKMEAEHFTTRDELASQTSRNVGRATAQITESNSSQHETTKGFVTKKLGQGMQDVRGDIEHAITISSNDVKDIVNDVVASAIKRIIRESRAVAAGIPENVNAHTSSTMNRVQRILADALAQAEDEIKKKMEAEHFATRDQLASQTSRNVGRATAQINENTSAQHETTKGYVTKQLGQAVQDVRGDIEQATTTSSKEVKDLVSDVVASAIKRIVGETKATVAGIPENVNAHTTGTINRVHRILADALAQAEDEIKKRVAEEGATTRDDGRVVTSRETNRTSLNAVAELRRAIGDVERRLLAHTTGVVADAKDQLEGDVRGEGQGIKDVASELIATAIRKITSENRAAVSGISEGINTHVTGTVKRARDAVVDRVAEAEGVVTKLVAEEGLQTRGEMGQREKVLNSNLAYHNQVLKELLQATVPQIAKIVNKATDIIREETNTRFNKQVEQMLEEIGHAIASNARKTKQHITENGMSLKEYLAQQGARFAKELGNVQNSVIDEIAREAKFTKEEIADAVAKLQSRNRYQLQKLKLYIADVAPNFYFEYRAELETIIRNTRGFGLNDALDTIPLLGGGGLGNIDRRLFRLHRAALRATNEFIVQQRAGISDPVAVRRQAVIGYRSNLNNPANTAAAENDIASDPALGGIPQGAINNSANLLALVTRKALEAASNAPNPDIVIEELGPRNRLTPSSLANECDHEQLNCESNKNEEAKED